MKKHLLLRSFLVLMMMGQTGIGAVALADSDPTPTPTVTASPTPDVSPSPTVSPSPAPSDSPSPSPAATPSPTASASPSPSPTASPTVSPSPTPTPTTGAGKKKDCPATGPCDPTGVVPTWVYNTGTGLWEAADTTSFTYDKASGYYLSPKYYLDKQDGWYEIIPAAQAASLPDYLVTAPNVVHTALGDVVVGSKDYELAKAIGLIAPDGSATVNATGADSTNQASVTNSNQSWFDLTNLVNVMNTLDSTAKTGDVAADSNTQVGNAVTGAANVLVNLINLLTSAWSWSNGGLNMFMQNLFGNVSGDITLNPTETVQGGGGSLAGSAGVTNTGDGSTNNASVNNSSTTGVNASNSGNIVNNINALAASGDASATGNTAVGNVASGNATAEINIINMINSYISSGSSFFGILNIFGNFNGDILFPAGFLTGGTSGSGSSAAGVATTGANSTNTAGVTNSNTSATNTTSNYGLANNINAVAGSGQVGLDSNTAAGTATSGSASTVGSTLNLTNNAIFGDNAVLVIVNVLGHWVGKIMSVPGAGGTSSSGLLTGNAQIGTTGPDSANNAGVTNTNNATVNQANTGSITNNVNVAAVSGDASAAKNTSVGDVSTGDAKVSTGVTNIVNSVINVKHWFGVLIVNVFGSWVGDAGDNTSAGDTPAAGTTTPANSTSGTPAQTAAAVHAAVATGAVSSTSNLSAPVVAAVAATGGTVLTAATHLTNNAVQIAHARNFNIIFWGAAALMLLAGALFSIERRLRNRL